jgi:hypothetical protein
MCVIDKWTVTWTTSTLQNGLLAKRFTNLISPFVSCMSIGHGKIFNSHITVFIQPKNDLMADIVRKINLSCINRVSRGSLMAVDFCQSLKRLQYFVTSCIRPESRKANTRQMSSFRPFVLSCLRQYDRPTRTNTHYFALSCFRHFDLTPRRHEHAKWQKSAIIGSSYS